MQMYNDPSCKPWTSRTWAPDGFASRHDVAEHNRAADAAKGEKMLSTSGHEAEGSESDETMRSEEVETKKRASTSTSGKAVV